MNKYNACIYARLSKEDCKNKESESITNQINLIKNYLSEKSDITIKMTKIDDGYSGSNFNRPAFKEMIEEIKKGAINCIVVKDFSRFGRNFIDTAKYIEKIFPMLNVRFIAINDSYDSINENEEDNIIVPFKNLINDAYVKDISLKVKSQKNMKMKNGEFIGSFATYGYLKDPKDKTKLIVDETVKNVIAEIFNLKIKGYSSQAIADKLNAKGILSPMEHKKSIGLNYETPFKKNDKAKWQALTVTRILKNDIYIGTLTQGKTTTINHKINLVSKKDKKDWYVIENNHTPIIDKQTFNTVQSILLKDTRISPYQNTVFKFSGIAVCGDCGRNMIMKNCGTKEKPNYYLICSGYKNKSGCNSHIIKYDTLDSIVLKTLQMYFSLFVNVANILNTIDEISDNNSKISTLKNVILEKEIEIEKYKNYKFKIYTDFNENLISKTEYLDYSQKYDIEIEKLSKIVLDLSTEIKNIKAGNTDREKWLKAFKELKNIPYLDRALIVTLLNKIEIYNNDTIVIKYLFENEFKKNLEFIRDFVEENTKLKPVLRSVMNG